MKTKSAGAEHGAAAEAAKKELELAREIHALVRLVRGQLVAVHPWAAATPGSPPMEALACPAPLPGPFPNPWSVPAVWPCFP